MDPQVAYSPVAVLALSPLAAWVGAFGILFTLQLICPAPRRSARTSGSSEQLLRTGALVVCVAWLVVILTVR